jgi:hypothetical protein
MVSMNMGFDLPLSVQPFRLNVANDFISMVIGDGAAGIIKISTESITAALRVAGSETT